MAVRRDMELEERVAHLERVVKEMAREKSAPNSDCLTDDDVAKWLNVSVDTVRRYEREGILVAIFPNTKKKFDKKDIIAFMRGYKSNGVLQKRL